MNSDMWRFGAASTDSDQIKTAAYNDLTRSTGSLAARAGELTDQFDRGADEAHQLHKKVLQSALREAAYDLELMPVRELLDELTDSFGFSWASLARALRLTPTALRKWRKGDDPSAENKQRLAHLVAFSRKLSEIDPRIASQGVGYYLEAPVLPETTLTRLDIVRAGEPVQILRLAHSGVRSGPDSLRPEQVLDELVPAWRDQHARDSRFEVTFDDQGMPTIAVTEPGA